MLEMSYYYYNKDYPHLVASYFILDSEFYSRQLTLVKENCIYICLEYPIHTPYSNISSHAIIPSKTLELYMGF